MNILKQFLQKEEKKIFDLEKFEDLTAGMDNLEYPFIDARLLQLQLIHRPNSDDLILAFFMLCVPLILCYGYVFNILDGPIVLVLFIVAFTLTVWALILIRRYVLYRMRYHNMYQKTLHEFEQKNKILKKQYEAESELVDEYLSKSGNSLLSKITDILETDNLDPIIKNRLISDFKEMLIIED